MPTKRVSPITRLHVVAICCGGWFAGCVASEDARPWTPPPPAGAPSLIFNEGMDPDEISRLGRPAQPAARGSDWEVDESFSSTVGRDGIQNRRRIRASRDVGGYRETVTSTTTPQGSTVRRSYRKTQR